MGMGFDELSISFDHLENVCRVCLSQSKNLVPIYQVNLTHKLNENGSTESVDLASVFLKFCDIEVSSTDWKPHKICELCLDMSLKAFDFFQKFIWINQLLDYKLIHKNDRNIENVDLEDEYENVSMADIDSESGDEDLGLDPSEHSGSEIEDEKPLAIRRLESVPKKIPTSVEEMDEVIQSLLSMEPEPKKRKRVNKRKTGFEVTDDGEEVFPCTFCKTRVTGFNEFVDHCFAEHPEKNKSCALCSYEVKMKTSLNRDYLIMHMARKHSNKAIVCKFCSIYFKSQEDLDKHNNVIDHEKKKCLLCNMDFSYKTRGVYGALLTHVSRVHELQEKNHLCSHCGKTFKYRPSLRRHIQAIHEGARERALCQHCGADFLTVFHLNNHMENVHGIAVKRSRKLCYKNSGVRRTRVCPTEHCARRFKSLHRLYVHADLHKLDFKNYKCQICSDVYVNFADLVKHQIQNHETYGCSNCDEKFVLKSDWKFHTRKRGSPKCSNEKSFFRCKFCPKAYESLVRFYFHSRVHSEFKDYLCNICNQEFDSYTSYSKHYDVHRTYVCSHSHCGKRFTTKLFLKNHSDKHNAKKFSCSICNATLVSQHLLRQHVRHVHLNERLYECKKCKKSFKQQSHLMAHQIQHGFQKPWKCDVCSLRFLFKSQLESHLRVHTGQKPYECLYCSKAFRDTSIRHKHIKKQHPEYMEEFLEYRKNEMRKDSAAIEAELKQEADMESRTSFSEDSDLEYKFEVPADCIDNGETLIYDDGDGMSPEWELEKSDHSEEDDSEDNEAGFEEFL